LNQLDFLTDNGVLTDYSYDSNGNLISEVTGSNSTVYRWANDGENRLMGVTVNESGVSRNVGYQYNAQGVRVGKVVDGVETRYLIDELQPYSQVVEEYDAAGNPKGSYVYGYDLVGKLQGNQPSFSHADGLGSTRVLTNNLGGVTDSYAYDAYGNLIASTGASNNAYLFAGEQRDSETGLDYLRARYYDPLVGRFVSADAYEGSLNDPMSLHDYQYAHANPVVNTDPSGYMTIGELLSTIATHTVLAGLSFTTGSAVGTVAGGGSIGDAVGLYDQFFAGMLDALSFGYSTKARELAYKDQALKHSGIYFNLGRFSGVIAGAWIGSLAATFKTLASAPWWARAALGYDLFGAGVGVHEILKDGATWSDVVSFIPLLLGVFGNLGLNIGLTSKGLKFGLEGNELNINPSAPSEITRFYHGTTAGYAKSMRIAGIDLSKGSKFSDFGQGFYLTASKEEALSSARRLAPDVPLDVVTFKVPNSELSNLSHLIFSDAGVDWQDFVKFHKTFGPIDLLHGEQPYDMVTGPLFRRYSREGIPSAWPDRSPQTSIHTQRAVKLFNLYMVLEE
jgi:RHS repeat-associated protein